MSNKHNDFKQWHKLRNKGKKIHILKFLSRLYFLVPVLIFSILWSWIMVRELNSFHLGIFDYGIDYNLVWKEAYGIPAFPSPVSYLPYFIPTKLISFFFVPYVRLFQNVSDLLIMQVIIISFPALILYLLSFKLTNNVLYSILIEIIWLLYYPNNALIYYGFHYQTVFPLFYIAAFVFFYLKKLKLSVVSLFLASITSLLAPIILLFTIPTFHILRKRMKDQFYEINIKIFYMFYAFIIAISLSILLLNYYYGGISIFKGQAIPTTSSASNLPIYISLWEKFLHVSGYHGFLYILFMTFPLVFSIFLEYEFILASIPAIAYYLVGYSGGYVRYFYPMQYSALISPMVFLSFLFLIKRKQYTTLISRPRRFYNFISVIKKSNINWKKAISVVLTFALVSNICLFLVYSPIGPLNSYLSDYPNLNPPSDGGYGLYKNLSLTIYDKNLLKMEELVPQNATVLSQFNMPQFSNRYYFTYPGQYNPNQPIDYAINDPQNYYRFTTSTDDTGPDFYNLNMLQLSNMLLQNSTYGVLAQSEGAILFKHGYSGSPIYYIPLNTSIKIDKSTGKTLSSETSILSPGTYKLTALLNVPSNSTLYFNGTKIGKFNGTELKTKLVIPIYEKVIFSLKGTNISGIVYLNQIEPAKTIDQYTSQTPPNYFRTFTANYTYFSPVSINDINLNRRDFSYLYMINLTTYEDGLTAPKDIGNDSQVFSLGGISVWNQVENDGKLEYGFRNENYTISQYIKPYIIKPGEWILIEATYNAGYVNLYVNGLNVFTSQIFPYGSSVGNTSTITIGGAHPFLHGNETYPNSNPINASIANFVILNGTLTLSKIQDPQTLLKNLSVNPNVVYSNWINSKRVMQMFKRN